MDPETHRRNFGWFGEPWPSGICYAPDGNVLHHNRIPTPVGEPCIDCGEAIEYGDQGKAMPYLGKEPRIGYTHRECLLRNVVGPISHLRGECDGTGTCSHDSGMTMRQEALAVWDWVRTNGWPQGWCSPGAAASPRRPDAPQ